MELSRPHAQTYSDSYLIFPDISVEAHTGDRVIASHDLVGHMYDFVSRRPLVKLGGGHYWLFGEYGLPADTIAAPAGSEIPTGKDDLPVLLAEDKATTQFMLAGMVHHP